MGRGGCLPPPGCLHAIDDLQSAHQLPSLLARADGGVVRDGVCLPWLSAMPSRSCKARSHSPALSQALMAAAPPPPSLSLSEGVTGLGVQ